MSGAIPLLPSSLLRANHGILGMTFTTDISTFASVETVLVSTDVQTRHLLKANQEY